ncbi:MAG: hypothetical protein ACREFN_16100, partial [Acetobacteraceae bacterium]
DPHGDRVAIANARFSADLKEKGSRPMPNPDLIVKERFSADLKEKGSRLARSSRSRRGTVFQRRPERKGIKTQREITSVE